MGGPKLIAALLSLAPLLAGPVAHAAPGDAGSAIVSARLLPGERLPLDGSLAHPAWQRAPVHQAFVEKAPHTGGVPAHATRVQVLFDEQALYVGIEAIDPDPALIRAPLVRHDGVNRTQDFVVVYLDAIGSRQSAQFFRVNAAGSTADGMHTASDDHEDFSPDFDFDAATARTTTGYTAVLRIPFASLRFASLRFASSGSGPLADAAAQGDTAAPQPWRILVARRVPREQFYLHSSVLIPRDAASFIATMQPLQGVQLPERHQFLSLRPSLTWRSQRTVAAGTPAGGLASASATTTTTTQGLEGTLDAKWRPMAEWVLDAALNPDFSQVALDVPQLAGNTRFALEFAEKRPFFFESSDLLRTPTAALYTRSFTELRWGLRSTWRGASLAGSAFAVDDRGGGLVLLPGVYGTDTAKQPASRALALRARHDAGALQWGGVVSSRHYADDRGDNQVAGPDLAWQISDAWRLRAQWLQSRTTALPPVAVPPVAVPPGGVAPLAQPAGGGLVRSAAVAGHKAYAKLWYQGPQVEGELALADSGAGFRNDSGFVGQNGVRSLHGRLARGWLPLGPFNEFWFNLEGEQVQDRQTGATVSRDLYPGFWLVGAHNLEAWAQWHGLQGATALRTGPDQPLLHEHYLKAGLSVTPATWAPLLDAELQWGRLADVTANRARPGGRATLGLVTRPLAPLELEPRLSYAWLNAAGQRVYGEAAHQLLARWHFTPRQSLRAIWQYTRLDRQAEPALGLLPAVHAQHSAGSTGSFTYAWRQSAGTVLYLGAARSRQGVADVSRGNEVFIKLQVDADEARRLF